MIRLSSTTIASKGWETANKRCRVPPTTVVAKVRHLHPTLYDTAPRGLTEISLLPPVPPLKTVTRVVDTAVRGEDAP